MEKNAKRKKTRAPVKINEKYIHAGIIYTVSYTLLKICANIFRKLNLKFHRFYVDSFSANGRKLIKLLYFYFYLSSVRVVGVFKAYLSLDLGALGWARN